MDFYGGMKLYEKFAANDKTEKSTASKSGSVIGTVFTVVICAIYLTICLWGASLSWRANTLAEWAVFAKVIFALFAFLSGVSYLFGYWIYKADLVNALVRHGVGAATAIAAVATVTA